MFLFRIQAVLLVIKKKSDHYHSNKLKVLQYFYTIYICKQESFNTNISHQVFENTITFVNSQH